MSLDTLPERIQYRLDELDMSARAASIEAGKLIARGLSTAFVQNILSGKSESPRADGLHALAVVLQTTDAWLLRKEGPEVVSTPDTSPPSVKSSDFRPADLRAPRRSEMPDDIEVHGTAAGSEAGSFLIGSTVDYVRRPPGLAKAKDIYAIFVVGSSMEPEHPPGELRFIHPHRHPKPGDSVVIQQQRADETEIEAYIGRLVRQTEKRFVIAKLNPKTELEFDPRSVKAMHKVLTMNDLFGI